MNTIKGSLAVQGKSFAIIVARFNSTITQSLLDGAVECLEKHGVDTSNIDIIWVPGAFELAATAKQVTQRGLHHAIICVGAVIKGETDHYDFVAGNTASGIAAVSQDSAIPVIFGVLTVHSVEQALNRSGIKAGNAGYDAAVAAIDMASVYQQIKDLS